MKKWPQENKKVVILGAQSVFTADLFTQALSFACD